MNSFRRRPPRRAAVLVAASAMTVVLAACGGNAGKGGGSPSASVAPAGTGSSAPAGQHNRADVAFAQGMIPHHRQAIDMAGMAAEQASSGEVKTLAAKIEKEQALEIDTMAAWLKSWGEQVPQGMSSMSGIGHGNPSAMPGMMSSHDMDQLKGASGKAFDTMFLNMMIKHHEGAVEMADAEKKQGAYGPAKGMAGDIVAGQSAEIAQMRAMLGGGSPSAGSS
ncbi:DUF305 domain-containing protein [Streptomyces morookaense]|uniref:DUF305 domain-containing protein n=1 Tax=Streptomyces morookaense TaxID=1970 RepID=UPI0033E32E54